ncbi:MAG TPA: YaeQ family protein, partial [Vicinamibacterales bacterium]|nr:YaeQ family protein [Vicinamibacterales bacterium]
MAQAATIYAFAVELADIDRGVYETLSVRVARQASETPAFMLTRLLAFCLEHTEGIVLTEGVA